MNKLFNERVDEAHNFAIEAERLMRNTKVISLKEFQEEVTKIYNFLINYPGFRTLELIGAFGRLCVFTGAATFEKLQKEENNKPENNLLEQLYIEKEIHAHDKNLLDAKISENKNLKVEIDKLNKTISQHDYYIKKIKYEKDKIIKNLEEDLLIAHKKHSFSELASIEEQLDAAKREIEKRDAKIKRIEYDLKQLQITRHVYSESTVIKDLENYVKYWKNEAIKGGSNKVQKRESPKQLTILRAKYTKLQKAYDELVQDPESKLIQKDKEIKLWKNKYNSLKVVHDKYKKKYKARNGYDGRTLSAVKGRYEQLIQKFNIKDKNKRIAELQSKYYTLKKEYETLKSKIENNKPTDKEKLNEQ